MELILIFFAVYLAVYLTLNLVAVRQRKRLVAAVAEAKEQVTDERWKKHLDSFVLSMTSMRTSVILFLILWQILLMPKQKVRSSPDIGDEQLALFKNGLMHTILESHMASAAAVNPLFGGLAYLLRCAVHVRYKIVLGEEAGVRELESVSARYVAC